MSSLGRALGPEEIVSLEMHFIRLAQDCSIVTLLTVYNSVSVVLIEGRNYGSDWKL